MDQDEDISPANRTTDLIGDGSQPYALPTLKRRNDRFKRIDATTLVKLIDGDFSDSIESFTIIDCRYPYEYIGGHIVNSLNIHNQNDLVKLFIDKTPDVTAHHNTHHNTYVQNRHQSQNHFINHDHNSANNSQSQTLLATPLTTTTTTTTTTAVTKRHIIIFHCEFSSERGPRLMRLLREKDRQINKYPELIHPELYLLEGGYRDFFKRYKEYCVPQAYKPMKSRNHRDELKNYRKRRRIAHIPLRRKENRMPDLSFEG